MSGGIEGKGIMRGRALSGLLLTATVCCLLIAPNALAVPPVIEQTAATQVLFDEATLRTVIDPEGKARKYHFEYGTAPCSEVPNPCTSFPLPEPQIPTGTDPVEREETVESLSSGTTYYYRVVVGTGTAEEVVGPDRTLTTLFLLPPFGPCPNEALRKGPTGAGPSLRLPDCRAYERASPKDKNGVSLIGELAPLRASIAGDAINFETSSGIPGAEGGQNYPYYLATRGATDWSTQGLLPHGSAGDDAKVTGWTRDFSWSFSAAEKRAEEKQAYLARSSADGTLEEVAKYTDLGDVVEVPLTPGTFFFAGASSDGSKVYFEATGPTQQDLSTKAAPNRNNLYGWDRDTEELELAGVLPDGSTPPGGSLAGPYDWVGGTTKATLATGGAIRGYYTQDDHAVSEDGSRAFFTAAGTGQLYLRENATEPGASTQHVSDSKRTPADPLGARPAAFMAATPDGSHAFFTSSEKLTNDATTGPEVSAIPAIAQAKTTTEPPEVDIDCLPTQADWVDVDDEFIYWTDTEAGTIGRASLGCDQNTIKPDFIVLPNIEIEQEPVKEPGVLTSVPPNPQDLAVNETDIYWTNATDGKKGTGTIGHSDINGTLASIDQECVTGASNPIGIDVNATHVYWANAFKNASNKGTIGRATLPDCTGADQEFIKPEDSNSVPNGVTLGETQVYWTMNQAALANVVRANLNGSEQKSFPIGNVEARGLTADENHVYWADADDNSIGRAELDFTDIEPKYIENAGFPIGLAVNSEHLYWTANQEVPDNPGNDLYRYDTETEELIDLVGNGPAPNGAEVIAVLGISEDASRAYFAANGDLDDTGPATKGNCKGATLEGSGECNLYLWEEGTPGFKFIARLDASNGIALNDALNWAPTTSGATTSRTDKTSRLSPDGSVLVFRSTQQLGDYENEGTPVFYRYDAQEDSLLCLTCNPTGTLPTTAGATLGSINAYLTGSSSGPPASTLTRNLSASGNRFFFESTERLVAEDTNGLSGCPSYKAGANEFPSCHDVYMWEASGTGSCESEIQNGGCIYLLSTGTEPKPSFFADAGASGADAFLITASPGLVFEDRDQLFDVYDARVGGGLAAQNEPPPVICEQEGCKPQPQPRLAEEPRSSSTVIHPGDPKPSRKACPKGKRKAKVKGKTRCVRKGRRAAKGKGKGRRAAKTTGRAGR